MCWGDPAEQFHNPYLAIGTTKREELLLWSNLASGEPVGKAVVYVDPDIYTTARQLSKINMRCKIYGLE